MGKIQNNVSILRKNFETPKSVKRSQGKVRKNSLKSMRKALQTPPSGKLRKSGVPPVKEVRKFYVQNTIDMFMKRSENFEKSPQFKRKKPFLPESCLESPVLKQKIPKHSSSEIFERKPRFGMDPGAGNAADINSRSNRNIWKGTEEKKIFGKGENKLKQNTLDRQI